MLHDRGFACGQVKLFLRLDDNLVLPCVDPDFTYHDEDSFLRSGLLNKGRAAKEYGAMESAHDVSELNLLAVLRIGSDFEGLLDCIGKTRDGWREHPVCRFPVLALNDLLAQFPRPPILIE